MWGGGENTLGFHLLSPAPCCPVKAGARQRPGTARQGESQHPGMVRGCGWERVPTHEPASPRRLMVGASSPASKRVFQGQLELPAGSGCDITDRRKSLGPGFSNETPVGAAARKFSLPLLLLRSPNCR